MAKYLISFPSKAMHIPDGELAAISRDSHAVVQQAKDAGVYVFAGGIDDSVAPVLVAGDGAVSEGGYSWARPLDGGVMVVEVASREEAILWAGRIASACRCQQELRVFYFDAMS